MAAAKLSTGHTDEVLLRSFAQCILFLWGNTHWLLSWCFLRFLLQGAPGRMGVQGEPGLKGYQVRILSASSSFYRFSNAAKMPLQDAQQFLNCDLFLILSSVLSLVSICTITTSPDVFGSSVP